MFSSKDKLFMERAFELAVESFDDEEVPVGAVIVKDGNIIGEGKNKVISNKYKEPLVKQRLFSFLLCQSVSILNLLL